MGPPIANPFRTKTAAEMYRRARLDHHLQAVAAMQELLGDGRPRRGLDVGCGTGPSTAALASVCDVAIGLDSAPAMVAIAAGDTGIPYVVSPAENAPFRSASFDALTIASALHWVDQERFFGECRRIIRPGGCLSIIDHFFVGIEGQGGYGEWVKHTYLQRYPMPFHGFLFGPESDVPAGFRRIGHRTYDDRRTMARSSVVDYHLSQSFVLAALEQRGGALEDAGAWVDDQLRQFIPDNTTATVNFVGTVAVLERSGPDEKSGGDGT